MPAKKREQWKLPKTFEEAPVVVGNIQRHDGEPRHYALVKHENDSSLRADAFVSCCDCGLTHHYTYNVFKEPRGTWYLQIRAYRSPHKGKGSK